MIHDLHNGFFYTTSGLRIRDTYNEINLSPWNIEIDQFYSIMTLSYPGIRLY